MMRSPHSTPRYLLSCLFALGLVVASGQAVASPIGPGLDYFITQPGAQVDISFLLPSVGVIDLKGDPFGPFGADTIVERLQGIDPFEICPTLPCSDTIDIELVALSLVSIDPIDLSDLGGPFIGVFSDGYFTINSGGIIPGLPQPDFLNPSIGQMEIFHGIGGGTFESCFGNTSDVAGVCSTLGIAGGGVFADAIFTIVGGDPTNPLDIFFSAAAPRIAISGLNGVWEHDGSGDDFSVLSVDDVCNFPPCHPITPIPEPGTAPLFGMALVALVAGRRHMRVRTQYSE